MFYLGPHAPRLTPKEIDLIHRVWLEVSGEIAPVEVHHHDIVHVAVEVFRDALHGSQRREMMDRLLKYLQAADDREERPA